MKKIVSLLLVCSCAAFMMAQNMVYPISERSNYKSSIAYYLPKSEVEVVIKAERTIEKPGPFYKYAERYLGLTDVIVRDRNVWRIVDADIHQRAVADPSKGTILSREKRGILYKTARLCRNW